MPNNSFPSDGQLPTGSIDITFEEIANTVYVANSFSWSQDASADLSRKHKDGTPKGSKVIRGFTNGSCDIQLPDASSTEPEIGYTFANGGKGYFITGRGKTQALDEEIKFTASIRLCVNPLIIGLVDDQALTQSVAMTALDAHSAVGPESGLTYSWSATGLPTGVSINSSTGEISGTPSAVETTTATIKASATNSDGNTVEGVRKIQFTVTA